MASTVIRAVLMVALLVAGYLWLRPKDGVELGEDVQFVEKARASGCLNVHTMVRLADVFENIMPWLSSAAYASAPTCSHLRWSIISNILDRRKS